MAKDATDLLCDILEATGLPYFRQGSLLPDEPYPEDFVTYWEPEAEEMYYDNKPVGCMHRFWVYVYTCHRMSLATRLPELRQALADAGFDTSPPVDAKSDERSHVGKVMEVKIIIYY